MNDSISKAALFIRERGAGIAIEVLINFAHGAEALVIPQSVECPFFLECGGACAVEPLREKWL